MPTAAQIKAAKEQREAQKAMSDAAIQQAEVMRKAQKDMVDAAVERERLRLDQTELALDAAEKEQRLDQARREAERQFQMNLLSMLQGPQGGGES